MNKLSIAIIRRKTASFGGIEHQIMYLIDGLINQGHKIFFICDDDEYVLYDILKKKGVNCIAVDLKSEKSIYNVAKYCKENHIDIIQSHMLRESRIARKIKLYYPKIKHVFRVHTYIDCSRIHSFKKVLYHCYSFVFDFLVDYYVSINEFNRKELINRSHIIPKKVQVINDGIPKIGDADYIEKREWPSRNIAMIANFDEGKGHKILIEGINILNQKEIIVNAYIIGGYSDRNFPVYQETLNLIKKYELENQVKICGFSNNIAKSLEDIPIVVLPSDSEGTPNCLLEAMSLKKVVVATNVGGVPEFITDMKNGILHKPKSPIEFGNAIIKTLNLTSQEMIDISNNGYETWEKYDSKSVVERMIKVYYSLINLDTIRG